MANKTRVEAINCLAKDAMTAEWQWHMTFVLTPAVYTEAMLNHRDLWCWCSWEETAAKPLIEPTLGPSQQNAELLKHAVEFE